MSTISPPTILDLAGTLRRLLSEHPGPEAEVIRARANADYKGGRLSVQVLSALINRAAALPKAEQAPVVVPEPPVVPVEAPKPAGPKPNEYPGECGFCGTLVMAHKGTRAYIQVIGHKGWAVTHAEGECIPEGRYAVEVDGVLKFFVLKGKEVSAQASDELHLLVGDEYIAQVLDLIRADTKAATVRYGTELGVCGICNRTLTDETSRAFGIGPVCRERKGW